MTQLDDVKKKFLDAVDSMTKEDIEFYSKIQPSQILSLLTIAKEFNDDNNLLERMLVKACYTTQHAKLIINVEKAFDSIWEGCESWFEDRSVDELADILEYTVSQYIWNPYAQDPHLPVLKDGTEPKCTIAVGKI